MHKTVLSLSLYCNGNVGAKLWGVCSFSFSLVVEVVSCCDVVTKWMCMLKLLPTGITGNLNVMKNIYWRTKSKVYNLWRFSFCLISHTLHWNFDTSHFPTCYITIQFSHPFFFFLVITLTLTTFVQHLHVFTFLSSPTRGYGMLIKQPQQYKQECFLRKWTTYFPAAATGSLTSSADVWQPEWDNALADGVNTSRVESWVDGWMNELHPERVQSSRALLSWSNVKGEIKNKGSIQWVFAF